MATTKGTCRVCCELLIHSLYWKSCEVLPLQEESHTIWKGHHHLILKYVFVLHQMNINTSKNRQSPMATSSSHLAHNAVLHFELHLRPWVTQYGRVPAPSLDLTVRLYSPLRIAHSIISPSTGAEPQRFVLNLRLLVLCIDATPDYDVTLCAPKQNTAAKVAHYGLRT